MVCWVFGEIGYRKLGSFNAIMISLFILQCHVHLLESIESICHAKWLNALSFT